MSACLCRLLGCVKKQKRKDPEATSSTSRRHSPDKQSEIDLEKISLRKIEILSHHGSAVVSTSLKDGEACPPPPKQLGPGLLLEFCREGRTVFSQIIRVGGPHQEQEQPKPQLASQKLSFSAGMLPTLAREFSIDNGSQILLAGYGVLSEWDTGDAVAEAKEARFFWKASMLSGLLLRRVCGSSVLGERTSVVCSGNVVVVRVGKLGLEVDYMVASKLQSRFFEFTSTSLIKAGRMIDCDIVLSGANCSRYQFCIEFRQGVWVISEGFMDKTPRQGVWLLQGPADCEVSAAASYWLAGFTVKCALLQAKTL